MTSQELIAARMTKYQCLVSAKELPSEDLRLLFDQLLVRLNLQIVREQTPDYTAYELQSRATSQSGE